MIRKYALITLLATSSILNGFSLSNLAWKNFNPTGSAHLYAGAAAVGGAAAALAGRYCYTKASQLCFDVWQNYVAQKYAIAQEMKTSKTYVVTVDLKNKKQPLTIVESTRPNKAHSLDGKIGQDTPVPFAPTSKNSLWQKAITVIDNAYVAGKTIAKNPETIAIPAGAATLLYMFGKPTTLKMGLAYAGIGTGIAWLTVKEFLKEKKQSHQDVLVTQAMNAILADARAKKLTTASYIVMFDFKTNAQTPIAITRESVLNVTHSNVHSL